MKPFKRNRGGWDDGSRFRIISRKKWGSTYVYKLLFAHRRPGFSPRVWVEYQEHRKLAGNDVFGYDREGRECPRGPAWYLGVRK